MLYREAVREQSSRKRTRQEEVIGAAVLKRDNLTGKKFWTTWDGEGQNEVIFSAGQPLMFPIEELQVGTRIHLISPEKWDD